MSKVEDFNPEDGKGGFADGFCFWGGWGQRCGIDDGNVVAGGTGMSEATAWI